MINTEVLVKTEAGLRRRKLGFGRNFFLVQSPEKLKPLRTCNPPFAIIAFGLVF